MSTLKKQKPNQLKTLDHTASGAIDQEHLLNLQFPSEHDVPQEYLVTHKAIAQRPLVRNVVEDHDGSETVYYETALDDNISLFYVSYEPDTVEITRRAGHDNMKASSIFTQDMRVVDLFLSFYRR